MTIQSTPRKSATKQAAVARRLLAASSIAPHVLASTIVVEGLKGEVIIKRAGRSFVVNGLQVAKGQRCILVASKFEGRYYVLTGGQWSTSDEKVVQVLRSKILQFAA